MKRNPSAVAEVELVYRHWVPAAQRPKVQRSSDACDILRAQWDEGKLCLLEQFYILMLDRSNRVMVSSLISTGGMAGTVADPKLIFATALKCRAAGLTLAHNHPSGNLTPSHADCCFPLAPALEQSANKRNTTNASSSPPRTAW